MRIKFPGGRLMLLAAAVLLLAQCSGTNTLNTMECTGCVAVTVTSALDSGLKDVTVEFVTQRYDANGMEIGPAERTEKAVDDQGSASYSRSYRLGIGEGFTVRITAYPKNWSGLLPGETVRFDWTVFDKEIGTPQHLVTKQVALKLVKN